MAEIAFAIEQVNFDREELNYNADTDYSDKIYEVINPITDFSQPISSNQKNNFPDIFGIQETKISSKLGTTYRPNTSQKLGNLYHILPETCDIHTKKLMIDQIHSMKATNKMKSNDECNNSVINEHVYKYPVGSISTYREKKSYLGVGSKLVGSRPPHTRKSERKRSKDSLKKFESSSNYSQSEYSDAESVYSDKTDLISNFSEISGFEEDVYQINAILSNVKQKSTNEKVLHGLKCKNDHDRVHYQEYGGKVYASKGLELGNSIYNQQFSSDVKENIFSNNKAVPIKKHQAVNDEIYNVRKENARLQGQMSALQGEHLILREQCNSQFDEISQLKLQLDLQMAKIAEMNNEKHLQTSEIQNLKQGNTSLSKKLSVCEYELGSRCQEISFLKQDHASIENANETLRIAFEKVKVDLSLRNNSIEALKTKISEYYSDLQTLLQEKLQLESQHRILQTQNTLLQKNLNNQKLHVEKVQETCNKAQQELLTLQSNHLALQSTKDKLESQIITLTREIATLRKNAVKEKENLSLIIQDIKADITAREALNQKFKVDRSEVEKALLERLELLESERQKYQKLVLAGSINEDELKSLKADIEERSTIIEKLENHWKISQQEVISLQQELLDYKNELKSKQQCNTQLQNLADSLKIDLADSVSTVEKIKVIVGTILYSAKMSDKATNNLEENLLFVLKTFQLLNNQISQKEKELEKLIEQQKKYETDQVNLIEKVGKLESFKALHEDCNSQRVKIELQEIELNQFKFNEKEYYNQLGKIFSQLEDLLVLLSGRNVHSNEPSRDPSTIEAIFDLFKDITLVVNTNLFKKPVTSSHYTQTDGAELKNFKDTENVQFPETIDKPSNNDSNTENILEIPIRNEPCEKINETYNDEKNAFLRKIEDFETQIKASGGEIEKLQKLLENIEEKNNQLESQLKIEQDQNVQLKQDNASLGSKYKTMADKYYELNGKYEAMADNGFTEIDLMKISIRDLKINCQEHVRRYESNIKLLTRKLREHMKARKETENSLANALKQLNDSNQHNVCDSEKSLTELSLQLETERGFVRGLQNTINSLQKTNMDFQTKMSNLEAAKSLSDQHSQELLISKENAIIGFKEKIDVLETDLSKSTEHQKDLNNQVQIEKGISSQYKSQLYSLTIGLETANQQITTLNMNIESLKSELMTSNNNYLSLNDSKKELANQYEEAILKVKLLEDTILTMKEKEPLLENQLQSLNLYIHKRNQEIKSLEEELKTKMIQQEKEVQYFDNCISELNKELAKYKADLKCCINEKSTIQLRALELQTTLSTMTERYKILQSRYQEIMNNTGQSLDLDCLPSPAPIDNDMIQSLLEKSLIEPHCKPLAQLQSCLDALKEEMMVLHSQLDTQI